MTHPAPTASCTGSRTDVSVYEPLCPTCRLPLDAEAREDNRLFTLDLYGRKPDGVSYWACEACGLPVWGWDWDDDADRLR